MKRELLCGPVRNRLQRLPPPFDNHYGVVPLPPPVEAIQVKSTTIVKALELIEEADRCWRSPGPKWDVPIMAAREARSSCAIEGFEASPDDCFQFDKTGVGTDAAKLVTAYRHTLQQAIERASAEGPRIFTRKFIEEIHARLMGPQSGYQDVPGRLRENVVWIGSGHIGHSTWNAPPPDDVPSCLEETLDYMRNDGMQQMTQNAITRMAIAHAHFEAVHPFRDGNGRVGRLLLPVMMVAQGHAPMWLSPHLEEHVGRYYGALRQAQQQLNWSGMIELFAEAILTSGQAV